MGHMFENMQQLLYIDQAGLGWKIQGLFQDYSRTFISFLKDSISSQFCTMHFFSQKRRNVFDSNIGDKPGLPHKLNRIEYESHLALRSAHSDFYSVSCDFYTVFLAHPINLNGLVVFYIFKD